MENTEFTKSKLNDVKPQKHACLRKATFLLTDFLGIKKGRGF